MNKLKYLCAMFVSFIIFLGSVEAASIGISSSNNTVTKGQSVNITVTVSSDTPLVSIEGTLMCKGAGVSSGIDLNFDDSSNSIYSKTFTHTIKPGSSGTITCSTSGTRITNMSSDNWQNIGSKSINVTVKEPQVIPPKNYSSNNNLKSLEVEGYKISPEFSKDTLEYTLEVPNGTEKIKINADKEDNSASISGNSEVSVSEGVNNFEIKVTAENGNVKAYKLIVTVKELDPINIKIKNEEYTVIRKEGILEPPANYEKKPITINNEEVLAYYNEKTKYTLVGLKNNNGESAWYVYNEKDNTYKEYNSFIVSGVYLVILDMPKDILPSGYHKTTLTHDNRKIDAYQYQEDKKSNNKSSDFYLLYAINELTGEKSLYTYDKQENTVQRYNLEVKKTTNYFLYFIVSTVLLIITVITFSIILIVKKKHKKRFA